MDTSFETRNSAADENRESKYAISLSDVEAAMTRIRSVVHYTPVMECSHLNALAQRKLYFKCENFQKTGSFKVGCY